MQDSSPQNGVYLDEDVNMQPVQAHHQHLSYQHQQLLHRLEMNQNQLFSPTQCTDETDDGTIDNNRVEYAVLLPDSFAVLDSTFEQHSL